jgi:hypothetical protein
MTGHDIEGTLLVQIHRDVGIVFESPCYGDHAPRAVLEAERAARTVLHRASLTWIHDPLIAYMLRDGNHELVDPGNEDEVGPPWMSTGSVLKLVEEARGVPLASLS